MFCYELGKFIENLPVNERVERNWLEAAIGFDIRCIFFREIVFLFGKKKGILKNDVWEPWAFLLTVPLTLTHFL